MGQPVVHFEIIGKDPAKLRSYFGELFGWKFDTSSPVAEAVSEPANYGFVTRISTSDGTGIPGGVGGGTGYPAHVVFYVGVRDVEAALQEAERLGGQRRAGQLPTAPSTLTALRRTGPHPASRPAPRLVSRRRAARPRASALGTTGHGHPRHHLRAPP